MKKIGFLLLSLLVFLACDNTPQGMAERGVKKHMKSTKEAYKAVSFGKLDTVQVKKLSEYVAAADSFKYNMEALKQTSDQFVLAAHQNAAKKFKAIMEDLEGYYKDRKYKINHTYNSAGEEKVQDIYLDPYFKVVDEE